MLDIFKHGRGVNRCQWMLVVLLSIGVLEQGVGDVMCGMEGW